MNDSEITALAREYAEEITKDIPSDNDIKSLRESAIKLNAEVMEKHLRWLLRRYALVEKSKVEKEYQSSKHYFEHTDNSNPTQKQYFWGRICALKYLFPEIAKEVEG